MTDKKTKGRRKIEMKRIENQDDRLVTFSKRKSGIYKKESELVTLTGAEVALVVFSPAGKPFSFAHPSVDSVTNRFLGEDHGPSDPSIQPLMEATDQQAVIEEITEKHNEMVDQLDANMDKSLKIQDELQTGENKGWWDAPIDELSLQELIELEQKYKALQKTLIKKMEDNSAGAASSSSAGAAPEMDKNSY